MKNLTIVTTLLVLMLPSIALSKPGDREGKGMAKVLKQLDLTEDQKKKLKEMRKANKENKFKGKDELKKLREEMKAKFVSDASDVDLKAIHAKIKKLRDEKAEKRFQKMLNIRSILTPDQRKKFQELQMGRRKGKRRK